MAEECGKRCDALSARIDALDNMLAEREERTKERFIAIADATRTATTALDRRLDVMNEFRAAMSDQTNKMLPVNVYDVQYKALVDRIAIADTRIAALERDAAATAAADTSKTASSEQGMRIVIARTQMIAVSISALALIASFVTIIFTILHR